MKAAVLAVAMTAVCLAVAGPAAAETVVAGEDGAISFYVSDENVGQRAHKFVRTDGSGGSLPIPSGLGNNFIPGAPFNDRRPFALPARRLKQLRVSAIDRAGTRERLRLVRR